MCTLAAVFAANEAATAAGPEAADVAAFQAFCAAKAAAAEQAGTIVVPGRDGWLFFSGELRHLGVGKFCGPEAARVSKAARPEHADPLPAILDFQAQMEKAGIELLLVPVPAKAVVYADMVCDRVKSGPEGPPRLDASHQEFYRLLRQKGVKVLDLTADFIAHRNDKEGPPFCKQDSHWSGWGCALAARRLAVEIKQRPWAAGVPRLKLVGEVKPASLDGDLRQALGGDKPAEETLWLRCVGLAGQGEAAPAEPDRQSPLVLLGDSHNLVFHSGGDMLAQGAGLADQLALELGFAVDLIGVRGSGATPARVNLLRLARADTQYLGRKKLLIWCFAAREFTESAGWQKVPVVK
jgi:alginate O-acetyltransferase complex protein AlgJ